MVVAFLFHYPPSAIPVQQQLDTIAKQLEAVGGERIGTYNVTCDVYVRSASANDQQMGAHRGQRTVSIVQHGSYPSACLTILENGNYAMCDSSMRALMGKLDAFNAKPELRSEVFGTTFSIGDGDFAVRIGAVQAGASKTVRGIIVEVEYGPCCMLSEGVRLLREFAVATFSPVAASGNQANSGVSAQQLSAALDATLSQFANPNSRWNAQTGPYDIIDTLFQYFDHFVQLRKAGGPAQPQSQAAAATAQPTPAFAGVTQMPSPAAHNSPLTVKR